jgi:hypothetical protein
MLITGSMSVMTTLLCPWNIARRYFLCGSQNVVDRSIFKSIIHAHSLVYIGVTSTSKKVLLATTLVGFLKAPLPVIVVVVVVVVSASLIFAKANPSPLFLWDLPHLGYSTKSPPPRLVVFVH